MKTPSPLAQRMLGITPETSPAAATVREDVPVPCAAVPRTTFRARLSKLRQQRDDTEPSSESSNDVQRVLGEATTIDDPDDKPEEQTADGAKSLVPKDAKELRGFGRGDVLLKGAGKTQPTVMEPTDPHEPEERLSPSLALVAPEATPDARKPIDPSKVPGSASRSFTVADLAKMGASKPAERPTMPVTSEERPDGQLEKAVTSEAEAYRLLNIASPQQQHLTENTAGIGESLLYKFSTMPEPTRSDGSAVYAAARKFMAR